MQHATTASRGNRGEELTEPIIEHFLLFIYVRQYVPETNEVPHNRQNGKMGTKQKMGTDVFF